MNATIHSQLKVSPKDGFLSVILSLHAFSMEVCDLGSYTAFHTICK